MSSGLFLVLFRLLLSLSTLVSCFSLFTGFISGKILDNCYLTVKPSFVFCLCTTPFLASCVSTVSNVGNGSIVNLKK